MKNKPLSDLKIRNAKVKDKDYQLGDQDGLYLLVKTTGNKLWQMRYTSPTTKRRNIGSYGKYPDVSLSQARLARDKYIKLIANGIDPVEHKKETKLKTARDKQGMCINLIDEWLKKEALNTKPITHKSKSRIFNKDIKPFLKNKHIKEVTIDDIVTIIENKLISAPEIASRLFTHLDNLFRFAVLKKYCSRNILSDIRKKDIVKPRVSKHMPKITNFGILKDLINEIYNYSGNFNIKNALKLVLHIPLRAENLCNLKWNQINFEKKTLTIPREDMKLNNINLDDFTMPLTNEVLKILQEHKDMQLVGLNSKEYVFLGFNNRQPINKESPNRALYRLGFNDEKSGRKIRLHGFRGTFRSLIDTLDTKGQCSFEVKERALDHYDKNLVVRSYNHKANYQEQMVELMAFWSEFICGLVEKVD